MTRKLRMFRRAEPDLVVLSGIWPAALPKMSSACRPYRYFHSAEKTRLDVV